MSSGGLGTLPIGSVGIGTTRDADRSGPCKSNPVAKPLDATATMTSRRGGTAMLERVRFGAYRPLKVTIEKGEERLERRVNRDRPRPTTFRFAHPQQAPFEVDERLRFPHAPRA